METAAETRRKERFGAKLMQEYPSRKAADLFVVLTEFVYDLRTRNLLDGTLYSIEDPRILVRLREDLKNGDYKTRYKKNAKEIDEILVNYIRFLMEDEALA